MPADCHAWRGRSSERCGKFRCGWVHERFCGCPCMHSQPAVRWAGLMVQSTRRVWMMRAAFPRRSLVVGHGLRGIASKTHQRLAILIDADNVPPRLAGAILEEVHKQIEGIAVDRRVYGDFSLPQVGAWKVAALEHGFETKMQASPSRTKNATDVRALERCTCHHHLHPHCCTWSCGSRYCAPR